MITITEFTKMLCLAFAQNLQFELPADPLMLLETYSQLTSKQQNKIFQFISLKTKQSIVLLQDLFDKEYKFKYSPSWPQEYKVKVQDLVLQLQDDYQYDKLCEIIIKKLQLADQTLYSLHEIKLFIKRNIKKSKPKNSETKNRTPVKQESSDFSEPEITEQECFNLMKSEVQDIMEEILKIPHPIIQALRKSYTQYVEKHSVSSKRVVFFNTVTPLHIAVYLNKPNYVKLLLKKYCRLQVIQTYTSLMMSILFNQKDIFDFLLPYEHSILVIQQHQKFNFISPKSTAYYISQYSSELYFRNKLCQFEYVFSLYVNPTIEDDLYEYYKLDSVSSLPDYNKYKKLNSEQQIKKLSLERGFELIPQTKITPYLQQQIINKEKITMLQSQFRIYSPKGVSNLTLAVLTFNQNLVEELVHYEAGMVNFGGNWNGFVIPKQSTASDIAEGILELFQDNDPNIKEFIGQFGNSSKELFLEKYEIMKNIFKVLENSVDILVDLKFIKEQEFQKLLVRSHFTKECDRQFYYEDQSYILQEYQDTQLQFSDLLQKCWLNRRQEILTSEKSSKQIPQQSDKFIQKEKVVQQVKKSTPEPKQLLKIEPKQKQIIQPIQQINQLIEQDKPKKNVKKPTTPQESPQILEEHMQHNLSSKDLEKQIKSQLNEQINQIQNLQIIPNDISLEIDHLVKIITQIDANQSRDFSNRNTQHNALICENQILAQFTKLQNEEILNLENQLNQIQIQLDEI